MLKLWLLLTAVSYTHLDVYKRQREGRRLERGAAPLKNLDRISLEHLHPWLREVELLLGHDVANTLYGPAGAAYIYGPQKGALPEQLPLLDRYLRHFAAVVESDLGVQIGEIPGGGAAGGIGAGLAGVLGGRLVPGVEEIMEIVGPVSYTHLPCALGLFLVRERAAVFPREADGGISGSLFQPRKH